MTHQKNMSMGHFHILVQSASNNHYHKTDCIKHKKDNYMQVSFDKMHLLIKWHSDISVYLPLMIFAFLFQ